jgi:hypothetical protein
MKGITSFKTMTKSGELILFLHRDDEFAMTIDDDELSFRAKFTRGDIEAIHKLIVSALYHEWEDE